MVEKATKSTEQAVAGDYAPGSFMPGPNVVIRRRLGSGLSATVYEAEAAIPYKGQVKLLGRPCAIKILHRLHATNSEMVDRLIGEAATLGCLRHPNVVQIYNAGFTSDEDARAFIVMELLDGVSGRELLRAQSQAPVQTAVEIGMGLAGGLAAIHSKGVIHQDLKPENIFVHEADDGATCKIFDLGVQRRARTLPSGGPEGEEGYQGTPTYSAPEQLEGEEVTPAADVYAFGVVLFEMLAGTRPYHLAEEADRSDRRRRKISSKGSHVSETLGSALVTAKRTQVAPPLSKYALVPPSLETLVARCLDRDPARRPSAAELETELREIWKSLDPSFKEGTQTTQDFLTSALRRARERATGASSAPEEPATPLAAAGAPVALQPTPVPTEVFRPARASSSPEHPSIASAPVEAGSAHLIATAPVALEPAPMPPAVPLLEREPSSLEPRPPIASAPVDAGSAPSIAARTPVTLEPAPVPPEASPPEGEPSSPEPRPPIASAPVAAGGAGSTAARASNTPTSSPIPPEASRAEREPAARAVVANGPVEAGAASSAHQAPTPTRGSRKIPILVGAAILMVAISVIAVRMKPEVSAGPDHRQGTPASAAPASALPSAVPPPGSAPSASEVAPQQEVSPPPAEVPPHVAPAPSAAETPASSSPTPTSASKTPVPATSASSVLVPPSLTSSPKPHPAPTASSVSAPPKKKAGHSDLLQQ
jgi:serine/threonine-protein kinase